MRVAARHGVSAVVADALAATGARLEPGAQGALTRDAQAAVAAGLKAKRLTLQVLDALNARALEPVLLKGIGLAVRLYPEQPLGRPSSDVDVLLSSSDLHIAREALGAMGLAEHRDTSLADVFEEHHHLSFLGPQGLVELHFRLFAGFGGGLFDDAAVFARTRPFELEGRKARVLGPEDEFAYLATHAANHAFLRASWLVDLQRYLLSAPDLDFAVMADRMRRAGFHAAVATALALLEDLLRVHLPPAAKTAFSLSWPRREATRRLFSGANVESARIAEHRVGSFLARLALVDSPRHGVRHVTDGMLRLFRRARNEG